MWDGLAAGKHATQFSTKEAAADCIRNSLGGGEWHVEQLFDWLVRYTRKPAESPAERVAREIYDVLTSRRGVTVWPDVGAFVSEFAPLIAAVNRDATRVAQLESIVDCAEGSELE